jgi:hypothetical protein
MKAPSLNPAAAGSFFIHHGEKFVVGLLMMFALMMVWWGVSAAQSQAVDSTRTPAAITDLASQAATAIELVKNVPRDRVPSVPPLAPRVDPWRPQQVKFADAPTRPLVLDGPVNDELRKRTKPEVFPISDLRAVAGVAVFADPAADARGGMALPPREPALVPPPSAPRGGGRPRPDGHGSDSLFGGGELLAPMVPDIPADEPIKPGRIAPFIVVTGLIPTAKQQAEFDRLFASVSFRDPRRDHPRWSEYIVERMKVAPVAPGTQPRWSRVQLVNVERLADVGLQPGGPVAPRDGPQLAEELLPSSYFLQPGEGEIEYAAALPARVDTGWGEEAIHPWFVPKVHELLEARAQLTDEDQEIAELTLAAVTAKPLGLVGKQVRLAGVALDSSSQRQRNVGLYKFGVQTADGKLAVEPEVIGDDETLVFATSEELGRKLSFDIEGDKPKACNLLVRIDLVGKTPVARLLQIDLLDEGGEVVATRQETSPEPVVFVGDPAIAGGGMPLEPLGAIGPRAENRIFRFVDLDVDEGAEYRYRVRFALRNPNVGLALQHVANVADTKGDFLLANYSNETAPVRVPDPTRIVARMIPRDATRKLKVRGDNVEVMVLTYSEATGGNFGLRSVVITPGGLANIDPSLNRPGDKRHYGEPATTDRMLLDVRGDQEERVESRTSQPTPPLEMIFLRPDGAFDVVTAADSEPLIRTYRSSLFQPGEHLPYEAPPPKRFPIPGRFP